jgi:hypothetical protein
MTCLWQWASGWLGRGTPRPDDRAADSARRPGAGGGGLGCSGRGSGSEVLRLAGCPGQSSRHGPTAPTPGRQAEPEPRDRRTSLGECHGIIQVGSIIESAGRPPGPEVRAASESEDRTQDCQRIGPPAGRGHGPALVSPVPASRATAPPGPPGAPPPRARCGCGRARRAYRDQDDSGGRPGCGGRAWLAAH